MCFKCQREFSGISIDDKLAIKDCIGILMILNRAIGMRTFKVGQLIRAIQIIHMLYVVYTAVLFTLN